MSTENNGENRLPDGRFGAGNPGKPKGAVSKTTKTVKEAVLAVFNEIQDDPNVNLSQFAKTHPKEFYALASKLIPTEVSAQVTTKLIKVVPPGEPLEELEE